jgi:UDP-N-acetylglucosamine:LPS N-acetylglucosamine transferase
MEPRKIVKLAQEKGLDCIAITDHDSIDGAIEAKKYENNKIKVLLGEEKITDHGDLIGINIKKEITEFNFFEAIKEIKQQGGFTILPHPYKGHKNVEEIAKYVDIIEVYNARASQNLNKNAYDLARKLGKPFVAGSDAHLYREIGLVVTRKKGQNSFEILQRFKCSDYNIYLSQVIKSFKHRKVNQFMDNLKSIVISLFINNIKFGWLFSLEVIKKIYFELLFRNFKNEVKNPDILFSSFLISWRKYMHPNGSSYEYDLMVGDVIERAKEKYNNISCIDIDSGHLLRVYKETRNKFNTSSDWVCFEQFITFKNIFLALYLAIKKSFGYQIDKNYESYLQTSNANLYQDIFNLLTAESIIDNAKPMSVFLTCEYCGIHKHLSYISNLRGVPIFALQHGNIYPNHKGYIYPKDIKNIMKNVLPHYTFVFSEYVKDLLTNNSIYKDNNVIISGNPRYDIFFYSDNIFSKMEIIKKYDLPKNKNVILWTTQCQGLSVEENKKNFKAVFETMQTIKDTTLIIKQHPREGEKYTKMIKEYQNDYMINAILTPKDSDTYELLFICDLMITKTSTTAMEAVALNKPVIILNLSGEPDPVEYVKEGVALGVYKEEDLKSAIEKLLRDDSELIKNRKKYIERYLYTIDGKATERVVNLITQMIEESRRRNEN